MSGVAKAPSPYFLGVERRENEVETLRREMAEHAEEEMKRYAEIVDMQDRLEVKVEAYNKESEARHTETQQQLGEISRSIEALARESQSFYASVRRAFPKDDDGDTDFSGHRKAHDAWIAQAKEDRELMAYVRLERSEKDEWNRTWKHVKVALLASVMLAVVTYIGIATWAALLRGPTP